MPLVRSVCLRRSWSQSARDAQMGKTKAKAKAQATLSCVGFYPLLIKMAAAVGKFASVPGKYWTNCPAADKVKRFKCTVISFVALHDYGDGVKGPGFFLKEMGEDGCGSLEPGVASGAEFVMSYPQPFLEHYYYENRAELPDAMREKLFPSNHALGLGTTGVGASPDAEGGADSNDGDAVGGEGAPAKVKQEVRRPPVFEFLEQVSSTLAMHGPKRGQYTIKNTCCVLTPAGPCGGSITTYSSGDGKAETTSNAWTHIREKAKSCPAHAQVLATLNTTNRNMVQLEDGEYVRVMNFEEAFPHHVNYVWCRARGIFSAHLGSKPLFRKYVRNYEPRAVFPHNEVQYNIALCIKELQDEEQLVRITVIQKEFKFGPCIGIQLDMWTDPNTHIAYGGINMVTTREPTPLVFSAGSTGTKEKKKPPQLHATSEVLDFDVFPQTEHSGATIREWFEGVMGVKKIYISCISGATPDGASDGQLGLRLVNGLGEKVDTCKLHGLQRSVLYSIGLAGKTSSNLACKMTLKAHNRTAQLSNQSRAVSDGIRKGQLAADVPLSKILSTVDTCTTRWGNQFRQVSRNNVLKPVIDPVVETYKRENRGKKDAIVEDDETNPTSRLGVAVPASAIGLNSLQWDESLEIESFLDHPFQIKDSIEHKGYVTGATSLFLLHDLKKGCAPDKALVVKAHPSTVKVEDRMRQTESRKAEDLHSLIVTARKKMVEELDARFFDNAERPSNIRLVQAWMGKQHPAEKWMPEAWRVLAKGLYLGMLREAGKIAGIGLRSSPPRKVQKMAGGTSSLVRNLSDDEDNLNSPAEPAANFDTVTDEAARWANLDKQKIREYLDKDGIVNEFALVYNLRNSFPLHYIVFKQTASHLPHEGNSEQLFSRAGGLSDNNGKMDPARLGVWTAIGVNYSTYKPTCAQILERYMLKFSKGGTAAQLHQDDIGLLDSGCEGEEAEYLVQAGSS